MVERVPATVLGRGVMSGGEAIACPGGGGGGRGNSHGGLCLCWEGKKPFRMVSRVRCTAVLPLRLCYWLPGCTAASTKQHGCGRNRVCLGGWNVCAWASMQACGRRLDALRPSPLANAAATNRATAARGSAGVHSGQHYVRVVKTCSCGYCLHTTWGGWHNSSNLSGP